MTVLSPGDCFACGETGRVVFLAALHDDRVFIACNSCKAAAHPVTFEQPWLAEEIHDLNHFAPRGFRLATEREVISLGYEARRIRILEDAEFRLFF